FGSDDIGTRVVRKVRCARTGAYAKWLAGHEGVNTIEAPTTDHVVKGWMEVGGKALLFSDRQIPQRIDSEYVAPIKVGPAALLPPVADIDRGTRGGSGECASRGRSDGIDRLIVNGLPIRVGKAGLQAVTEALPQRCLTAVIVGVSSGINIRDRCKLLIGPELGCRGVLLDTTCKVACGILLDIGLRCRVIHERAGNDSGVHEGNSAVGAACSIRSAAIAKVLL